MALALLLAVLTAPTGYCRLVRVSTFEELSAACHGALPGDTIVLAAGVYRIRSASRLSITSRPGPVLLKGATGNPADVVIEGAGQDAPAVEMIFDLDDSPCWTFEDFSTRNSYYHGFKFNGGSTNCVLRHVVMRDHGESGVKGTSNPKLGRYPDHLLVEGCDIGFSSARGGTRGVVEGIDGVGVKGWIIRSNRFVNVVKPGGTAYAVFTKGNSADTLIEANRFEDCCVGASFGGGGTGPPYFRDNNREAEHRGGMIRNNVFLRCADAAVYINKGKDCRICNNTIFECALTIQLRFPESTGWVRNNLIKRSPANPDEPLVRLRDGARLLAVETNRAATEADFIHPTGPTAGLDVHLKPGAGPIDVGADARPEQ